MGALCTAGRSCAAYDRVGRAPAPADAGGPLCRACCARAESDIRALPIDYWELQDELVPGRATELGRRGGSPDRVPLALHVEALQRDIVWTLQVWEPPVREVAGLPPEQTRGVRDSWAVAVAAGVVAPRIGLLVALGPTCGYADGLVAGPVERDGLYAVESLRRLHRLARSALGLTRRVFVLQGDCSGCGATALRRRDASDTVWCDACNGRWSFDDYQRYVGLVFDAA
jgi:hypothetical protein